MLLIQYTSIYYGSLVQLVRIPDLHSGGHRFESYNYHHYRHKLICEGVVKLILSDREIIKMLDDKSLGIFPLNREQIQPASVDIRLGNSFSTINPKCGLITMNDGIYYNTVESNTYIIEPHQFVLATTLEYITLPDNLSAFVEGRSSLGRLGLFIQNAGWVDPGFEGEITLELYNASDCAIELECGRRVGQLVFAQMNSNAINPYNGKYQCQMGGSVSVIFLDFECR